MKQVVTESFLMFERASKMCVNIQAKIMNVKFIPGMT